MEELMKRLYEALFALGAARTREESDLLSALEGRLAFHYKTVLKGGTGYDGPYVWVPYRQKGSN